MIPRILISTEELAAQRDAWKASGHSIAFVPTMGALHEGHLSLVGRAQTLADKVIVSIFVNPTQFGPKEDYSQYPRTLKADSELLASVGVEAIYAPNATTMYPEGFATWVQNRSMADQLCGLSRKGHFDGVLTVVLKLFNQVRPDVAVFGKKDFQQFRLIDAMVRDLNVPVRIVGAETVREPGGLAMSSRNRYLSDTERETALRLYRGLDAAKQLRSRGESDPAALTAACTEVLTADPGIEVEYVELRRSFDLTAFPGKVEGGSVLLVAVRLGTTRLIDNMELD